MSQPDLHLNKFNPINKYPRVISKTWVHGLTDLGLLKYFIFFNTSNKTGIILFSDQSPPPITTCNVY